MSFPAYPAYKDSTISWLGRVPSHWNVLRLKHACEVFPSNVDKHARDDEPPVRLCNYTDVYYNERITADMPFMEATASEEQIARFTLRGGDTIITKDSETADDIAVAAYVPDDLPGVVCGYHLSMVRPRGSTCGAFVKRLFDSIYAKARFAVAANGLTRVGLGQYAVDNIDLPFPPVDEQRAIVAFLDRETAKIDALVEEQKRLIELLKEKRQAVISQAVTKGLDQNVQMKSTGQVVGVIPVGWAAKRLKYLVRHADGIQMGPFGGMLLQLESEDTGFKVYGQENTISGDFTLGTRWVTEERFNVMRSYQIEVGDLLLTRKGSLGNARLIANIQQPGVIDSDTIRVRVQPNLMQPELLALLLHEADYISDQIALAKRGAILPGLNSETIANIEIALPPHDQQVALLQFLREQRGQFDQLVADAQLSIHLLQERRSALISAAVTGKIDVRGLVPQPEVISA